jgi:hypothetical protein
VSATITVRHGETQVDLDAGATAIQALKALDAIRGQIVAALVDGAEWDLDRPVPDGAEVAGLYADTDQGRAILRHSTAHLMAQAVTDLFPGAKWAIGPRSRTASTTTSRWHGRSPPRTWTRSKRGCRTREGAPGLRARGGRA